MDMKEREEARRKEEERIEKERRMLTLQERIIIVSRDLDNNISNLRGFSKSKKELNPKKLMADIQQAYTGCANVLDSFRELESLGDVEKDGYKDYFEKIMWVRFYLKKIIPMVDKKLGEKIKEIDNENKNSISKSEKGSKVKEFFAGISNIFRRFKSEEKRKTSKYSLEK